jgi:very-short-patch-repair endonuclease
LGLIDPSSSFERSFLDYLYSKGLHLPHHAQHTPAKGIAVQPDFYYERDGIPGVCIFIDGPHHDEPMQVQHDLNVREALKDQGFRVIAIRASRPIAEQVSENLDIFG